MSQNIEVSLTEILAKIDGRLEKIDDKLQHVEISIEKLNEKVDGIGKRLVNLEFVYRSISVGIIGAILLAIFRYLFPEVTP